MNPTMNESSSSQPVKAAPNDDQFRKKLDWEPSSSSSSSPASPGSKRTSTAYHRLQYVCGALALMEDLAGQMPVEYHGPEFEIEGPRCFQLLKIAMNKDDDKALTYRELWDFVNVLYMTLRQLHDEHSPLNSAMAPDPFVVSKVDAEIKQTMKGEIVNFLVRTARDFASNNPEQQDSGPRKDEGRLSSSGFSRPEFNSDYWRLMPFQVAGKNCYRASGQRMYYLYFRAGSGKWVIDDDIVPSGTAYSVSTTSSLTGIWMTSSGWREAPWIRVTLDSSRRNLFVSGCRGRKDDQGASSSTMDNGLYVLQKDKINGKEHYLMKSPELDAVGEQRHLIWSEQGKCWKITPICGEEEGSFVSGEYGQLDPTKGVWRSVPADVADSVRFTIPDETSSKKMVVTTTTTTTTTATKTLSSKEEDDDDDGDEDIVDDDDDEENEDDSSSQQLSSLVPWNKRNHESLVFSNRTSTLAFFSADPAKLKERMNPCLIKFLETNRITVGENLHSATTERYHKLLCALTNVKRKPSESSTLLGGRFAITGDALLKLLAVVTRIRCGIPVVLLGECGCGKTYSIRFLAAFLDVQLFVLDVHGGTEEKDVLRVVEEAETYVKETGREAMVFMDEINACAHLGLIEEVLIQRTIYGQKRVDDRVCFLAALNPYREVPQTDDKDEAGLRYLPAFANSTATTTMKKKKNLVYLVHPVPSPLVHIAFDFGALRMQEERQYISSMCRSALEDAAKSFSVVSEALQSKEIHSLMVNWICAAQSLVREKEKDASAASLRDAQRALRLTLWFLSLADKRPKTKEKPLAAVANCAVLALAFAYMFRLPSRRLRESFWDALRTATSGGEALPPALRSYRRSGVFEAVLSSTQRAFCSKFALEPGIALNEALSENLFLSVVCVLNRIPLFLVGKPGTSKTLALQIAASNLLGKNSPVAFWRRFPALAMFTYQCSPLSTAQEIKRQFDLACRFQAHAGVEQQISVFVLDEVGLAEFSPAMPLKVLHSTLVDPPVAVVGVSNWTLDRAKMNRAILLTRPEPSAFDLRFTGERISQSFRKSPTTARLPRDDDDDGEQDVEEEEKDDGDDEWWLKGVADTFHELYAHEQQQGREFWGMRDYYALVRQLKLSKRMDPETLVVALCRNLGGKPEQMEAIAIRFLQAVFPVMYPPNKGGLGSGATALGA